MGCRYNRDRFPGDVNAKRKAGLVNGRKPTFYIAGVLVADIKVNTVIAAGLHLGIDCPGNCVAGGKVAPGVIFLHEMESSFINQPAAFTAYCFRDQEIFCFRVV